MNSNELRIGNYYSCASNEGIIYPRVKTIQYNEFGFLSDIDGTNFGICKPIPLTEEWLLRFGFEWYGRITGWTINEHSINEKNGCFEFCINKEFSVELKYVHQLQNLYFALTGEELTLKTEL